MNFRRGRSLPKGDAIRFNKAKPRANVQSGLVEERGVKRGKEGKQTEGKGKEEDKTPFVFLSSVQFLMKYLKEKKSMPENINVLSVPSSYVPGAPLSLSVCVSWCHRAIW